MSEVAVPEKDPKTGRFLAGNSGFGGRKKGSRNKLGEAFIEALHDDFAEHGVAAIQVVRAEKPDQYLKVIASLLPKEMNLNVREQFSEMTDDELAERARLLARELAPFLSGIGSDPAGDEGASRTAKSAGVH
jgi:hypothetical protein